MDEKAGAGTIGKYRIVGRIGSGGFGTVFEGWDPVIKRRVAIKVCDSRKEVRDRFLQEAELAGRLHHPNITAVYECGVEGETPFIVQEFLTGEDLSARIARHAESDLAEKVKVLVGIAVGLEYAHRLGVVHRDVKPANIRVLENGMVKIMDFGIAKAMDTPGVVTATGVTVGSTSYMAPEQICGDPIDPRTDVFSFGVLAYELLAQRKAFDSENLFRTLEMIVKEEPEPLALAAPWLPEALCEAVARAMRKKPAERFSSMKELRTALVAAVPIQTASAQPGPVPMPFSEGKRREALKRYAVVGTPAEAEFDDLARLAARVCRTPMGLIAFVDGDRVWFKAAIGTRLRETPSEGALCALAAADHDLVIVEDAAADERAARDPLVRGETAARFYAGAPLVTPEGVGIGTLCVLSDRPGELPPEDREALRVLAAQVMAQLELRRRRRESDSSGERLLLEVSGLSDPPPGEGLANG